VLRYLRRDEDPGNTPGYTLLRRQACEAWTDLAMVGLDWQDGSARALRRAVFAYHLRMAAGRAGSDRPGEPLRVVPLRRGDVRLDALARFTLSDLFVLREIFVHQVYRYPYERGGPVRRVLDLGSNIGMSPLYFSLHYPGAEVMCVEPVAGNVGLLRRQTARNRGLRWRIEPVAVAARSGETTLFPNGWSASSSTTPRVARTRAAQAHRPESRLARPPVTVPTLSVNDLLKRAGWDGADVLKMDIEGAEEGVLLDGAPDWLHRVRTLAVDIHAKYVSRAAILARLAEYGFRPAAQAGPHSAIFSRPSDPG
jgi:FkbM family methyltransferase